VNAPLVPDHTAQLAVSSAIATPALKNNTVINTDFFMVHVLIFVL
jgi:hypothetical protein